MVQRLVENLQFLKNYLRYIPLFTLVRGGYIVLILMFFLLAEKQGSQFSEYMEKLDRVAMQQILSDINISTNSKQFSIYYKNENINSFLKTSEINNNVQFVANKHFIRVMINQFLQSIAKKCSIIVDGRDMGTVVFPNAMIKFFLNANISTRAQRSYLDYKKKGIQKNVRAIQKALLQRDTLDKNRKWGALSCAKDAIYIDNTKISLEQSVLNIKNHIDSQLKQYT